MRFFLPLRQARTASLQLRLEKALENAQSITNVEFNTTICCG